MLRVIGGEAKGRRLNVLKGRAIRPTADRVKESLFNILGEKVSETEALDLFAGVGNLGIEALSRGAKRVTFVDKEVACIRIIRSNLDSLGFNYRAFVYKEEVNKAVRMFARQRRKFGLVFIDPPYESDLAGETLSALGDRRIVDNDGIVVVEHHRKKIMPEEIGDLKLVREKKYGDTLLSFYKYQSKNTKKM